MKKLRVEIENETRVYPESLNFEIEMRVSQKSAPRTVGNGNLRANIILFVSVLLEHKVFVEHIFGLVICPWHPFKTFAIQ